MHTYDFEFADGHIVLTCGEDRLLMDTGAPGSVSPQGSIQFAGRMCAAQQTYLGVTVEKLSQYTGTRVTGLLGMDVISGYDMCIDPVRGTLEVSETAQSYEGETLELDFVMGVPVIEVGIGDRSVRMFFDTGAKLSYASSSLTRGLPVVGSAQDFYPGVGEFEVDVHELPLQVGAELLEMKVGNLPSLLEMTLMMANTQGILGTEIFQSYAIGLAARRSELVLLPLD